MTRSYCWLRNSALAIACITRLAMAAPVAAAGLPAPWELRGSNPGEYEIGLDGSVTYGGKSSAYIKSTGMNLDALGFGTLMQQTSAVPFRGKSIRWTAYVKTANIQTWSGLWMRIDAKDRPSIRFDNMHDRKIIGSVDWTKYEITLDVPASSDTISFGILMGGRGAAYINAISLDEVIVAPKPPVALDFEKQ